jgi:CheY-like chemotaxis protein
MAYEGALKVVAVSDDALLPALLDALLVDESDYNVIAVESITHAYSRIREFGPDLIVVFMEIDDLNACELLSMLEADRVLRKIPVVTCATEPERAATSVLGVIADRSRSVERATLHG